MDFFLILKPFSTISLNDWPCFEHDSQNWTFLFKMTQRIEHMTWLKVLIELLKNITQRIECFLNMTHRIEPLFFWIWLQELNFLSIFVFFFQKKKIHRFEPFSTWLRENEPDFQNLTHRIEPSSQKDSKNWTLKDYLIPTTKPSYDSWNWTLFCFWIEEIKPSFSKLWFKLLDLFWTELTELNTLKIWLTEYDPLWKIWLKEFEPFFSTWVKENDSIFDHDSKNISFYIFDSKNNDPFWEIMTQRIELLLKKHNDSKNWTFFKKSKNFDPSLPIWLTPRIQAFWTFSYDSKNWTLSWIWLKELDLFQNDSKNWTVSQNDSKNLTSFSQNDSKNWTFSSKWLKIFVLWIWLRIDFLIMILRMVLFCLLWL